MLRAHPIQKLFTRAHVLPLLGYAALIMSLGVITWLALASLAGDYADYTAAADLLDRLEGRSLRAGRPALLLARPARRFWKGGP